MAHSACGIANQFLDRARAEGRTLTPMQIQKLCYLAHGFNLALFDEPLIKDKAFAWDWGPVYPELYDAVKRFGSGSIEGDICENNWAFMPHIRGNRVDADLNEREAALVDRVWKDYGEFDGFQLSALTHEDGSPWEAVYRPGVKNILIPDDLIKEYFVGVTNGTIPHLQPAA